MNAFPCVVLCLLELSIKTSESLKLLIPLLQGTIFSQNFLSAGTFL